MLKVTLEINVLLRDKSMKLQNLLMVFIVTFLMGVQTSYSRDTNPGPTFAPEKGQTVPITEEALITINMPIELIKREAIKALEEPGTQIKKVHRLDFDPLTKQVIMDLEAELPADIMSDMDEIAGKDGSLTLHHRIQLSLVLPDAKWLTRNSFRVKFTEFKIDGHSYLNAYNRLTQYVTGLLVNTSFMNYMLNDNPDMELTPDNLPLQIKQLIEKKGLKFGLDTLSFKLNSVEIPQLKDFAELADIRIWNFSPFLVKGTKDQVMFRIEAGIGKPDKTWYKANKDRVAADKRTLEEFRKDLYVEMSNVKDVVGQLDFYIDDMIKQYGLTNVFTRESNEIQRLRSSISSRTRDTLTKKNKYFLADPVTAKERFIEETQEHIVAKLADIKRKHFTDTKIKNGGRNGSDVPFMTKRISENTLQQATRFFRDFEFENEQMFPELFIAFDPRLPGLQLRGIMNVDINVFMAMGLEGSGIKWEKKPWRAAEDTWGKGMPFEVGLRVRMLDGGWLGLDVNNFSILSGSERTSLDVASKHGRIMARWVKLALVQTMATTLIEDPTAAVPGTEEDAEDNPYKQILKNITKQTMSYSDIGNNLGLEALIKLAKNDIENNPFLLAGKEHVEGKLELFFKDLIQYDEESGLIKIKLDPRVATETILASDNNVQVWNIESLYDKVMNKNYIELALGNKTRTKKYLKKIHTRAEFEDSQQFVGIDESRKESPRDMMLNLNLPSLERLINGILNDAYRQQNKDVNKALRQNKESSNYLVKDMNLKVVRDGVLKLNTTITHIAKSKKGWLSSWWSGKDYNYARKSISMSATVGLSVEKLSRYKNQIKLSSNEVFLGDEILRLDLQEARFTTKGDTSILDKVLNVIGRKINLKNGLIASKLKKVVLHFASEYINSTDSRKNGNMELGGVKFNKYAKLLTHKGEILIQLNPHIGGVAFDLRLLNNQKFNNRDLGLLLKKSTNELTLDFSTAGNMAAVDKGEILRIMAKTDAIFKPYLEEEDTQKFVKMLSSPGLFDKTFYNSDYVKMSLSHRLRKVMSQYDGITDLIEADTTIIDSMNATWRAKFPGLKENPFKPAERDGFNNRALTVSGVEISYILAAAVVLKVKVDALVQKIEDKGIFIDDSLDALVNKSKDLEERIILPLLDVYREKYRAHNERIVNKGPTDWNHTFYPDARFSDLVYKSVMEALR